MLSFEGHSIDEIAHRIAERIRNQRLLRGWSRAELSARSGVAVPTLRQFEDTGKISLARLLKLAAAMDILDEFGRLATTAEPTRSLADLETFALARRRQRGRTLGKDPR